VTGPAGGLVAAIDATLGDHVTACVPVVGGSINDAYRVTLRDRTLFVKTHPRGQPNLFRREAAGLSWLREAGAVRVPDVVAVADDGETFVRFLALEWVDQGAAAPDHDEVLGQELAALHRFGAPTFGLDEDNFIGDLPQRNEPATRWSEFYATRRLAPLVRLAVERGRLEGSITTRFERLYDRLDDLVGPIEAPSRLHGDLWSGNAMVGADGYPWLVDPAIYGGHREVDLAMMRLFGGFGERCFAAYDEALPLTAGHHDRVGLYQLYPLLVHVVLFGGGYASTLRATLRRYVA
jgi:fructosamine-3-kinase